jgi:hypothetical protein
MVFFRSAATNPASGEHTTGSGVGAGSRESTFEGVMVGEAEGIMIVGRTRSSVGRRTGVLVEEGRDSEGVLQPAARRIPVPKITLTIPDKPIRTS